MRPPQWGNYVAYADWDLLGFAVLNRSGLIPLSFYHAAQALEKYLKALMFSITEQDVRTQTKEQKIHRLDGLAKMCADRYPYYGQSNTLATLKRLSKLDQTTRYPYVTEETGAVFGSSGDLPVMWDLYKRLRNDIPITRDDYPLGVLLRGHTHHHPQHPMGSVYMHFYGDCANALRSLYPNANELVRW